MMSMNYLAKRIKSIYDFNEFELKPENLVFLATKFLEIIDSHKLSDKIVESFFNDLEINSEIFRISFTHCLPIFSFTSILSLIVFFTS